MSRAFSKPKFSTPLNEYHVQVGPKLCLTYVHSGTNNMILLHHFRLYAGLIHTKQSIPSSFLRLRMNLHVERT